MPLFSLSYTSCHTISLDFMHIKYLGVDQHIFGAVLELLTTIMLPKSAEENLKDVWAALQNAYRVLHTPPSARYRYLTKLTMFIRAGYAKLRGKASEVRHLGRALSRVFDDFMNDALQIHRDISRMLHFNIEMENILEQNRAKYALPEEEATRFARSCDAMLLLQERIARHFAISGSQLFNLTSKSHMLQHLGILARAINPRLTWCWSGEDFMQQTQALAQSAVRGVRATDVMTKMARKYRVGLHLKFAEAA